MHNATPHGAYRADIDGLRAISVAAVVAYHAFWRQRFGGFVGVDIFFVISGFLISGILMADLEQGRFTLAGFYGRRVRRIYPALVLVVGVTLAAGWLQLFDAAFHQLGLHVAASAAFVINLLLNSEAGYFDTASDTKPLLHLWSLGVEEQFYIVWPLVLAGLYRLSGGRARAVLGWVLPVLLAASLAQDWWLMGRDGAAAFYLPTARFWEMLAGAWLAWSRWRAPGRWADGLGLAGLAVLGLSLWYITADTPFPGLAAVPPVAAGVLLIAAGPEGVVGRWLLSPAPLRWLGGISYPLYLWHWPLLVMARVAGFGGPGAMAGAVALAVALAWVTARWVERPLRFGGHGRAKLAGLLGAMAALGLIGLAVNRLALPSATSARAAAVSRQMLWQIPVGTPAQIDACHRLLPGRLAMGGGVNDFCYLAHAGAPDVALIGDSLNLSLFPGLAAHRDINPLLISASEAAPFYAITTTEWFDKTRLGYWHLTDQALDYAIAAPTIRVVVLSYMNGDRLTVAGSAHVITDRAADATPGRTPRAVFERALARTLARLTAAGKRVILVLPNQRMTFDMAGCLNGLRPVHADRAVLCGEPRGSAVEHQRLAYVGWVRAVAAGWPAVRVVDLAPSLCDARGCLAMRQGQMLYRDRLHLSAQGSVVVAPVLYRAIRDALR